MFIGRIACFPGFFFVYYSFGSLSMIGVASMSTTCAMAHNFLVKSKRKYTFPLFRHPLPPARCSALLLIALEIEIFRE